MARKSNKALVLRTCRKDMTSKDGFIWNGVGKETIAPDWKDSKECGKGLHGWLYGAGDHSCSNYLNADALWLVVEVELSAVIMLGEKCKFERAKTKFVGDKKAATDYLRANEPRSLNVAVIGATIEVGDEATASVGALGTSTSGTRGTSTSGDGGTSTSGYGGTSTSGTRGTSTSGDGGTSTSGTRGTSTSGDGGTSTSGEKGEIRIRYWDDKAERHRTVIGYIGENGLEPNVKYKLDDNHQFVAVKD